MTEEYTLAIQPISQSWVEGTGKFGDNPKNTNGCSWENRSNPIGGKSLLMLGLFTGTIIIKC